MSLIPGHHPLLLFRHSHRSFHSGNRNLKTIIIVEPITFGHTTTVTTTTIAVTTAIQRRQCGRHHGRYSTSSSKRSIEKAPGTRVTIPKPNRSRCRRYQQADISATLCDLHCAAVRAPASEGDSGSESEDARQLVQLPDGGLAAELLPTQLLAVEI